MKVSAIQTPTSYWRTASKAAALSLAAATVAALGAACSSGGSAGGALSGGGREAIGGSDCSAVENIYSIGSYSPTGSSRYEPYAGGTIDLESVELPDGNTQNYDSSGASLDINTLSEEQIDQLKESYRITVDEIDRVKASYDQPSYQDGFVVLHGKELADVSASSPEDGVVDDKDLQVCVFSAKNQGSLSGDQFAR